MNNKIKYLLLILSLLALIVFASCGDKEGTALEFQEINNGEEYQVLAGTALNEKELVIPAEYNGKPVTTIAASAFDGVSVITKVTLPDTIKTICYNAFYNCLNLEEINLPDSLEAIERFAFFGCNKLKSFSIPENVSVIGDGAFASCAVLEKLEVSAENQVFVSNGNCIIKKEAKALVAGCNTSVIPTDGSVELIGDYAFFYCKGITSISLPDNVKSVGSNSFSHATALVKFEVSPLTSLEAIGSHAFSGCSSLAEITVPFIGTSASSSNEFFGSIFGAATAKECKTEIPAALTSIKLVKATSIPVNAFTGCGNIRSISLPETIKKIGKTAFMDCVLLADVYIGNIESWLKINFGDSAANPFMYAKRLYVDGKLATSIVIPEGTVEILPYAFTGLDSFTEITLPASLTKIGIMAFTNCNGLYVINNNSSIALVFGDNMDNGSVSNAALFINNPDGTTDTAGTDTVTYKIVDDYIIEIEASKYTVLGYIGDETTLTLPLDIEGNAYSIRSMRGVVDVIFPEGITEIASKAFAGCKTLTSLTLPKSLTSVGSNAFQNCNLVTSVTYQGTIEEYKKITGRTNIGKLTVVCSDGSVKQ